MAVIFNSAIDQDAYKRRSSWRWAYLVTWLRCGVLVFFVLLYATAAQAGNPIVGIAAGDAMFQACAKLSPALEQRYNRWLERFAPDMTDLISQARMLPEYENLTKHIEIEFVKYPKDELLRECTAEFDREMGQPKK